MKKGKPKVLFLCTGNSCRSQMAEGWARFLKADVMDAYSAGIEHCGLNETAVRVMAEAGVDIASHRSKSMDELADVDFDYIVTVCDHARESCPYVSSSSVHIHVGFPDPPILAAEVAEQGGDEQACLDCYRRVRDSIRTFIETLPEARIREAKDT